ncbi:titin-like isoform X2 [Oryzias latipes]|uniref:titin-like isoform X2 n=1 Tax=Oryzias latipes TaxID=8090 RepID=UPI000CE1E9A2|nr:titin-like isoform X2 [Oryzias latipes]
MSKQHAGEGARMYSFVRNESESILVVSGLKKIRLNRGSCRMRARSNRSLQVCPCCGWSKVTSYRGLRIHQGKMGCTQKGMRVMEHQQQYLCEQKQQYLCEQKIQWNLTLNVDCVVKIESLDVPDPSLQVCHCGWTKRTTYQGLLIHQGRMECTLKGAMIPEKEKYDSRHNTEEKEHQWKPLPEMFPEGLRGSCRKSSAAAKMEYSSPEPPHSTQRGYSARYLEAPQALTQKAVSEEMQIHHRIKREPESHPVWRTAEQAPELQRQDFCSDLQVEQVDRPVKSPPLVGQSKKRHRSVVRPKKKNQSVFHPKNRSQPVVQQKNKESPVALSKNKISPVVWPKTIDTPLVRPMNPHVVQPKIIDQLVDQPETKEPPIIQSKKKNPPQVLPKNKHPLVVLPKNTDPPVVLPKNKNPPMVWPKTTETLLVRPMNPHVVQPKIRDQFIDQPETKDPPIVQSKNRDPPQVLPRNKHPPVVLPKNTDPPVVLPKNKNPRMVWPKTTETQLVRPMNLHVVQPKIKDQFVDQPETKDPPIVQSKNRDPPQVLPRNKHPPVVVPKNTNPSVVLTKNTDLPVVLPKHKYPPEVWPKTIDSPLAHPMNLHVVQPKIRDQFVDQPETKDPPIVQSKNRDPPQVLPMNKHPPVVVPKNTNPSVVQTKNTLPLVALPKHKYPPMAWPKTMDTHLAHPMNLHVVQPKIRDQLVDQPETKDPPIVQSKKKNPPQVLPKNKHPPVVVPQNTNPPLVLTKNTLPLVALPNNTDVSLSKIKDTSVLLPKTTDPPIVLSKNPDPPVAFSKNRDPSVQGEKHPHPVLVELQNALQRKQSLSEEREKELETKDISAVALSPSGTKVAVGNKSASGLSERKQPNLKKLSSGQENISPHPVIQTEMESSLFSTKLKDFERIPVGAGAQPTIKVKEKEVSPTKPLVPLKLKVHSCLVAVQAVEETGVLFHEEETENQSVTGVRRATTPSSSLAQDPASLSEAAPGDFSAGMKVKDLAQMFSGMSAKIGSNKKREPKEVHQLSQSVKETTSTAESSQTEVSQEVPLLSEPPTLITDMKVKERLQMFKSLESKTPKKKQQLFQVKTHARGISFATKEETMLAKKTNREEQKGVKTFGNLVTAVSKQNLSAVKPTAGRKATTSLKVKDLVQMFSALSVPPK